MNSVGNLQSWLLHTSGLNTQSGGGVQKNMLGLLFNVVLKSKMKKEIKYCYSLVHRGIASWLSLPPEQGFLREECAHFYYKVWTKPILTKWMCGIRGFFLR